VAAASVCVHGCTFFGAEARVVFCYVWPAAHLIMHEGVHLAWCCSVCAGGMHTVWMVSALPNMSQQERASAGWYARASKAHVDAVSQC
jgi:hypothetical protein